MLNLLFLSLWVFNASGSMSQFRACTDNHTWASPRCSKTPAATDCLQFAQACKTQCQSVISYHESNERTRRSTPAGQPKPASILVPSELSAAQRNLQKCTGWVTANGGDSADDDAAEPIVDDGTGPRSAGNSVAQCREYKAKMDSAAKIAEIVKTPEQLASCVAVCREATEGRPTTDREVVELTQIGTKCYENIPEDAAEPGSEDTSVASDDGSEEDSSEVTSNNPSQTPTDQGLSSLSNLFQSPPSVGTDLSGNLDVVNWATGPSPDMSLFDTAASNASAAANTGYGFQSPGAINGAIQKASVGHVGAKASGDNGGAGGAGGVPSPFMGGGGMPPGNPGSPAGRSAASGSRSGGYGPIAGSQLQKVGQNTFYSGGGGSMIPAGGPKVAVNPDKKRKPAFNPRYAPKSNDGSTALARMFGKTVRPDALPHRPTSGFANYGQSCLNTVFCGIENRFQDLLQDFDTAEPVMADTTESKKVRGTASDKKP